MADNVTLNEMSGGDTCAADEISGIKHQRVKIEWGPDGTANEADTASGKPLPFQLRGSDGMDLLKGEYETVDANQTGQVLGTSGAAGDHIESVLIVPENTSPGSVTLLDNATAFILFEGGANSVMSLIPFSVFLGWRSINGAWKISTGDDVHCAASGNFT